MDSGHRSGRRDLGRLSETAGRIPAGATKKIHRDIAYYELVWSDLLPVSRHAINGSVPSLPGIWELYWLQHSRIPRILKMGMAWYGGVRNELRSEADESNPNNGEIVSYLETGDCYYRYCIVENSEDLLELYEVLTSLRGLDPPSVQAPRRYKDVRVLEDDEMIIRRRRTPREPQLPHEPFGNRVPNMFDVLRELKNEAGSASNDG